MNTPRSSKIWIDIFTDGCNVTSDTVNTHSVAGWGAVVIMNHGTPQQQLNYAQGPVTGATNNTNCVECAAMIGGMRYALRKAAEMGYDSKDCKIVLHSDQTDDATLRPSHNDTGITGQYNALIKEHGIIREHTQATKNYKNPLAPYMDTADKLAYQAAVRDRLAQQGFIHRDTHSARLSGEHALALIERQSIIPSHEVSQEPTIELHATVKQPRPRIPPPVGHGICRRRYDIYTSSSWLAADENNPSDSGGWATIIIKSEDGRETKRRMLQGFKEDGSTASGLEYNAIVNSLSHILQRWSPRDSAPTEIFVHTDTADLSAINASDPTHPYIGMINTLQKQSNIAVRPAVIDPCGLSSPEEQVLMNAVREAATAQAYKFRLKTQNFLHTDHRLVENEAYSFIDAIRAQSSEHGRTRT